jgi:hypothetical protein
VTKKSTENSPINQNNTSSTFPEKKVNTSESKESHENLPNFKWSKYINNPPALNFVTQQ